MIMAFYLTSGSAAKYFSAALALAISTTTIPMAIFPALYLCGRSTPTCIAPTRPRW